MGDQQVSDDEIVYCRIPRSTPWFEPPDRLSTANFKLNKRRGDIGLSVYQSSIVTAEQVLAKPDAIPGSLIAAARVGDIRRLVNGLGEPLHLDVVAVDFEDNPGHAEIRGPIAGQLVPAASKALRDLFRLVD